MLKYKLKDMNRIERLCYDLASEAHKEHTRWNNDPYITHPIRIANSFKEKINSDIYPRDKFVEVDEQWINYKLKNNHFYPIDGFQCACVSYLHDVLEDCPDYSANSLVESGVPTEIVWPVVILTKLPNEPYLDYLLRIKHSNNVTALSVKIHDIMDNLSDLHEYDKLGKQIDRYQMALYILK